MLALRVQSAVIAIVLSALLGPAFARPIDPDGDGPPGPPDPVDPTCTRPATATATVGASPSKITLGDSATIIWAVTVPPKCTEDSITLNGLPVAAADSMTVQPMTNQVYAISFHGVQLASTRIDVTLPPVVRIRGNTTDWKALLIQALATENTHVILADTIDMDLTGHATIGINRGVTLTSEAPKLVSPAAFVPVGIPRPPARDARHLGPRLYTRGRAHPLFEIKCFSEHGDHGAADNVRINGFRLHGPDIGAPRGSENLDRGIMIIGCKGIEIANMELAGWSGQAIAVNDLEDLPWPGRIDEPDDVKIQDNFFHHNQQWSGGNGYGVVVAHGGYALIERNVFDFNRHAIAADGDDGTGYTARLNLVLQGGGYHCWEIVQGICWNTHDFDVHGTENCAFQGEYSCGQAGEHFEFTQNAFQSIDGYAIKVRGDPTDSALAANNVFPHGGDSEAIAQNGSTNPIEKRDNQFGVLTYGHYGVCDFDGDRKDDLFLATGVSWWYASGGRMHWTFLKAATERLDQVGFGDFDGDGRCDVFAVNRFARQWEISPGGSGAWTALPGSYDLPFETLRFGDFNGDGITDVFHRTPEGHWYKISPGIYDWTRLQDSPLPLSELRFGYFDHDRIMDVIAVEGGRWAVSWGGATPWWPLNTELSDSLESVMIGDIDGDGLDDIVRYILQEDDPYSAEYVTATWEVSWGGTRAWEPPLATRQWPVYPDTPSPIDRVRSFIGRFDNWPGADLLVLDTDRKAYIYRNGRLGFARHSLYAF